MLISVVLYGELLSQRRVILLTVHELGHVLGSTHDPSNDALGHRCTPAGNNGIIVYSSTSHHKNIINSLM